MLKFAFEGQRQAIKERVELQREQAAEIERKTQAGWRLWYEQMGRFKPAPKPEERWEEYEEPEAMDLPPNPSFHAKPEDVARCRYCTPRMIKKRRLVS